MSYKDILVYVDNAKSAPVRLDVAAKLANRHGARLAALSVDCAPHMPIGVAGTGATAPIKDWRKSVRAERAAKIETLINDAARRNGIDIELRHEEGILEDIIQVHGYYADLIVVSQHGDTADPEQALDPSPGVVALSSGRPLLVVPNWAGGYEPGKHILVAWKPCAEASRAIHDALPLLEAAERVTLFEANIDATRSIRLVGAEMAGHLARHGVKVTVSTGSVSYVDDGPLILSKAAESSADMIVMGAYGHSRLREVVMGGVTNHILNGHHIPVFMSH